MKMELFVLLAFSPVEANSGLVGFAFVFFAGIWVWGLRTQIHHLSFSAPKWPFLHSKDTTF